MLAMFTPDSSQLCGLSYETAEIFGKPHINAYYRGSSVKSHTKMPNAQCACCGKRATNAHHLIPLSKAKTFTMPTPWGRFVLKTPLFALCGSGTTGCHDGFHGGARFKAEWVWYSDAGAEAWWNGELLRRVEPHSPKLYDHGFWRIHDRRLGRIIEIKE